MRQGRCRVGGQASSIHVGSGLEEFVQVKVRKLQISIDCADAFNLFQGDIIIIISGSPSSKELKTCLLAGKQADYFSTGLRSKSLDCGASSWTRRCSSPWTLLY